MASVVYFDFSAELSILSEQGRVAIAGGLLRVHSRYHLNRYDRAVESPGWPGRIPAHISFLTDEVAMMSDTFEVFANAWAAELPVTELELTKTFPSLVTAAARKGHWAICARASDDPSLHEGSIAKWRADLLEGPAVPSTLAIALKAFREDVGWSQERLAEEIGLTSKSVASVEQGKNGFGIANHKKVETVLSGLLKRAVNLPKFR